MGRMYDAIILGGGLAGASMAGVLSAGGWSTALIDGHTFPRHKVCGEFLSPESQGILASLGLKTLMDALHPSAIDRAQLTLASGLSLHIPLPGTALGVSRYLLDHALHQAVRDQGGEVQTGVVVSSICRSEQGYHVETQLNQERRTMEARIVIGAWGRNPRSGLTTPHEPNLSPNSDPDPNHSHGAKSGSAPKTASRHSYIGVKSHFTGIQQGRAVELYFFPGGYMGVSPIEGGRVNAAALLTREAFNKAGKSVHGVMEAASRLNPALHRRLEYGQMVPGSQAATFPVITGRKPAAWDLVPHIGDAAVVIPPLCGDGMAMALKSVELCAHLADRYLKGEISLENWRDEYTQALMKEFAAPLRWGSLLQYALGKPLLASMLLRAGLLSPRLAFRLVQATRI
ncbi:NAD(P)/FAD-dependent oxidoreductase [Paenibacillus eucommiae]|uniref:Flavin-dependent dehydrogenase n=1 Tax=Paenibacillus eucommiae TaxID=1355755 RepID=A0ABS4J256_9BACL|nr:FAD-dependent monooxygenase [Paenibacillus eucommiae]MBP1993921.1 flavin-dependent dehydrogenase [Paenibacillus eucommiae]